MFSRLLTFLDGKKAKILSLATIVIPFLASIGTIDEKLANVILGCFGVIFGSAAYATDRVLGRRNVYGQRTK